MDKHESFYSSLTAARGADRPEPIKEFAAKWMALCTAEGIPFDTLVSKMRHRLNPFADLGDESDIRSELVWDGDTGGESGWKPPNA